MVSANVAIVGLGQAGGSLASVIATLFQTQNILIANTSRQDTEALEVPRDKIRVLGSDGGAGKRREIGRQLTFTNARLIAEDLKDKEIVTKKTQLIFVCFSTAGGTGSGGGPLLTAFLRSDEFAEIVGARNITVVGLFAMPSTREGEKAMLNTIDCLSEIQKLVDKAAFIPIDNDFSSKPTIKEAYAEVNDNVAAQLYSYLSDFQQSRTACLDIADRLTGLSLPGLHSFFTFDANGIISPFALPSGGRVKQMLYQINEAAIPQLTDYTLSMGFKVGDTIAGTFEEGSQGNIVHLAGSSNLPKLSEKYAERQKQLTVSLATAGKTDQAGSGFATIRADKKAMDESTKVKAASGLDDLASMLDS